jgi:epoxyqueuosine reductase
LIELEKAGFKARAVSSRHLRELEEKIATLRASGALDKRLSEVYLQFDYQLPSARTVFIVSIPQALTRAYFTWKGRVYSADIPPTYISKGDDSKANAALHASLDRAGFQISRVRLPAKTLAARSGLASYGRNNVTYVPGWGSYHRLIAFWSDCPCDEDTWQEASVMKQCGKCLRCVENCPTGCISKDRFLIHAENCLTWHNEREDDFEPWIKPGWHNALVGCMRCQEACPMNRAQTSRIQQGPLFSEDETEVLLCKTPSDKLPAGTRQKLARVAMDDSASVLARNLSALLSSQE